MKLKIERARLEGKAPSLFTLLIVIAFASINAVFYTPGLVAIEKAFKVSVGDAQMTMTLFLIGYALGQLIYGPLANRFGRKPALYIGISLTLMGNFMCAFSGVMGSFHFLLWGRLVVSLGSCAGLTLALAIITDYYYPRDARKIIAYVTLGFAAIPGISIAIGGALIDYFGWESAFWAMGVYAAFAWIRVARLPETGRNLHRHATELRQVIRRYITTFRSTVLIRYGVMAGLGTSLVYIFSTAAPFIVIKRFSVTESDYGFYFLIASCGLLVGGIITGQLSHKLPGRRVMLGGLVLLFTGLLALFFVLFAKGSWPLFFFLSVSFAFLAISPIYSNATAFATSEMDDKATASAAVSFLNMGTAVLGVFLFSLFPGMPGHVLPFVLIGVALLLTLLFIATRHCQDNEF